MLSRIEKLQIIFVSLIIIFLLLTASGTIYASPKPYEPLHSEDWEEGYEKGWDASMQKILSVCGQSFITQTVIGNIETGEAYILTCNVEPYKGQRNPKKLPKRTL